MKNSLIKIKHTAGKWNEIENDDKTEFYVSFDNEPFLTVHHNETSVRETKANAKLIASAPELLEALYLINSMCADAANTPGGKLNISEVAKASIVAIKKAGYA